CDPFDGGPYLEAEVDSIPLVRATRRATREAGEPQGGRPAFVSCAADAALGFRAVRAVVELDGERVRTAAVAAAAIGARPGAAIGITELGQA
ncbi:MAG: arginine N-succinyltransferase, partial [Planctomycetota bacterium]